MNDSLLEMPEPTEAEHRAAQEVLAEQRERRIEAERERIENSERLFAEALDGRETAYLMELHRGGDYYECGRALCRFMRRAVDDYAKVLEEQNR